MVPAITANQVGILPERSEDRPGLGTHNLRTLRQRGCALVANELLVGVVFGSLAKKFLDLRVARRDPSSQIFGQVHDGAISRFDRKQGCVAGVKFNALGLVVQSALSGSSLLDGDTQRCRSNLIERGDGGWLQQR